MLHSVKEALREGRAGIEGRKEGGKGGGRALMGRGGAAGAVSTLAAHLSEQAAMIMRRGGGAAVVEVGGGGREEEAGQVHRDGLLHHVSEWLLPPVVPGGEGVNAGGGGGEVEASGAQIGTKGGKNGLLGPRKILPLGKCQACGGHEAFLPGAKEKSGREGARVGGREVGCGQDGGHTGTKRAVYDVFGGVWLSWWTCCGAVKVEDGEEGL